MTAKTVSHYEILSPAGRGGMGVVYLSRDTRLNRRVALKILPAEQMLHAERRARFVREAQAASALNHPNIVHIYDIDTADGVPFIAMEYVEGRTLDRVIGARGLPPGQIVDYAVQMADALAAAHAAGIVHRDLKPSNVMVTPGGLLKILDFGLAKLLDGGDGVDGDQTRTLVPATVHGAIVGTPRYMSPEQAEGKPVDPRSDIFSLGSLLYEMTAGRPAFAGPSTIDVLHEVVHGRPQPLTDVAPTTPVALRFIIEKALEKDPNDRYQATTELVVDLKRLQRSLSLDAHESHPTLPRPRGMALAAIAIALLAVAGLLVWRWSTAAPPWISPLADAEFRRLTDFPGAEFDAVLSSDGRFAAFLANRGGTVDIWVTQIGTGQYTNLTQGQWRMLWSIPTTLQTLAYTPSGTHVAAFFNSTTTLFPVMGGAPRTLLDPGFEAVWSPDGTMLAYHDASVGDPIFVADADGSNRRLLFRGDAGEHCHYLSWSPDGAFLYFTRGIVTASEMDVWRVPTGGGAAERLTFHGMQTSHPLALDDRTLLYISTAEDAARTVLYALDLKQRQARTINLGIRQYLSLAATADRQRLVVTESTAAAGVWTMPISGSGSRPAVRLELPTAQAFAPRWGPDYLVYLYAAGGADGLWKLQDGAATELWSGDRGGLMAAPAISPDGSELAFAVRQRGRTRLMRMAASGANAVALAPSLHVRGVPSWSPDQQWLVVSGDDGSGPGLFTVPVGGGTPQRLLHGRTYHPLWSPAGDVIVYSEGEDVGGVLRVKAIRQDRTPVPLPELIVGYVWDPYRFLPGGNALVVLQGGSGGVEQTFWIVDLATGERRPLMRPGVTGVIRSFDVTADGAALVFDVTEENADIVLIERSRVAAR